jgi:hypothetical protein
MSDTKKQFDAEFDTLRTLRDELKVQVHLAASEARDAYDDVEQKWDHAEAKLKVLGEEASDSAERVGEALQLVLDEIRDGYANIKKLI